MYEGFAQDSYSLRVALFMYTESFGVAFMIFDAPEDNVFGFFSDFSAITGKQIKPGDWTLSNNINIMP